MKTKELSCKDLMVGDWVRIKITQHNTKVTNIDANSIYTEVVFPIRYNEIEPIPLTAEILEKNGFRNMYGKSNAYVNSESEAKYICFSIGDYDYTSLWGGSDQDFVWITVKYVHQLQHALRLCSIDKEIIL